MKLMKPFALAAAAILAVGMANAEHLKSLDPKGIDKNTPATKDFYHHVNRGWMEANPLTPEHARYGMFDILNDSSNNRVQRIVLGLQNSNPQQGTVAQKVSDLYQQGMDSVRRNQLGAQPIVPLLEMIQNTKAADMPALLLKMHKEYSSPFFTVAPMEHLLNSNVYAMYIGGGELGMGDRDYYLKNDADTKKVREAYKKLIQDQMINAGFSKKDAKRIMNSVMKIETAIAEAALTKEESRDIPAMYNPRTLDQLKADYPNVDWDNFFVETMGIETPQEFILTEPKGMARSNELLENTTDREKKDLYLWEIVSSAAPYLSDAFGDTNFEFSKVMSGVSQQRPRWKRSLGVASNLMGEAIGQLYVQEYFPQSSKDYMVGLVENLRNALGKHIINLPWMSDDTKVQALKKLNSITVKIGYPDKWKDYSELAIDPSLSYYDNVHAAHIWANNQLLKKWGKPVDKTEWGMTPQTINAYYNPMANEIVFPAGILQAPFFDPEASDAENYGGIGVVIGHELTHGFDDQGCNFDADGNMINWWTPEDAGAFKELTQGLAAQFDKVEVLPGLMANGQYTLGENIADQGGLRVAYTAFLDAQRKKGVDVTSQEAVIDGFDPAQVFYMNYANLWAQNITPEEIRNLTKGDVHSLGENRVNVSLKNIEPFVKAFDVQPGDDMYLPVEERVIIW